MKKTIIILTVLLTIYSGNLFGNNVILNSSIDFNQIGSHQITRPVINNNELELPLLTEREAAMVAYNNFLDNETNHMAEYKVRVSEVNFNDGVYRVSLKLVSSVDGSFVRNLLQYEINGRTGKVISTYRIRSSEKSIEEILSRNDLVSQEELSNMVDKLARNKNEVVELVINELKDNCGDALNNLATLMRTAEDNNSSLTSRLKTISDSLTKRIFAEVTSGNLEINRETTRLLDEIRFI